MTKHIDIIQENNLAAVAKALYREKYQHTRRADGSQLWKDSGALAGVVARGCVDGFIAHTKLQNRRVYLLKEDAIKFIDEYAKTRVNSNGTTKYTLADIKKEMTAEDCETQPTPKFGRVSRWLGIDSLWKVAKDISCQLLRMQETLDAIRKTWQ